MCLYSAYPPAYPGLSGWFADHMAFPRVMILCMMTMTMIMVVMSTLMVAAGAYPNVGATLSTDKPWIDDSDRDVLYPALSAKVLQTLCFRRSVLILAYPGLVRLFFW